MFPLTTGIVAEKTKIQKPEAANAKVWEWEEKPLLLALSLQRPLLTQFSITSSSKEVFCTEPAVKDGFGAERQ